MIRPMTFYAAILSLAIATFGASASLLGLPDVGFITLTEMADAVRRMTLRVSIPVVADGDTGHGDLHNIVRTVREFERAGAAGILLEDQVTPKRCGHFAGKQLIAAEEMVLKLRAALDARQDPDFVIIARTDARAVEGIDGAIVRARRYAATGADVCGSANCCVCAVSSSSCWAWRATGTRRRWVRRGTRSTGTACGRSTGYW